MVGIVDARTENSFSKLLSYKLGEGKHIAFWKANWLGNGTLTQQFPLLYGGLKIMMVW